VGSRPSIPIAFLLALAGPAHAAPGGLDGLLARSGIVLPAGTRQAILVTTSSAAASSGELRRYRRGAGGFARVGAAIAIRIGAAGFGRGRGLPVGGALASLPEKREGDRRSPAGVFRLGVAFGSRARVPGSWPWRRTDARDRFVDDPASPHYNTWQRQPTRGRARWRSAEDLSRYSLGLVVEHNTSPVTAGAGSAIFLHATPSLRTPSVGCTVMAERDLLELLRWLRTEDRPLLVQLPARVVD
jgi:L,D-peptidoglycan transpeptidase YkuD (ErfK/YbiS/YcfS/YnhG family)